jgi:hypothetical protein
MFYREIIDVCSDTHTKHIKYTVCVYRRQNREKWQFALWRLSVCLSVSIEQLGSHWAGFHEIWFLKVFSKICVKSSKFINNWHERLHFTWRPIYIYDNMRNISGQFNRENQNTHFIFNNFPHPHPRKSCRLRNNVVKHGKLRPPTDDNVIQRVRIACWITKATDTHSEYAILVSFPRQQWLRERASVLRCT